MFRIAALAYATVLMTAGFGEYAHPAGRWAVLGLMTAWTAFITWVYAAPHRRTWPVLTADLLVAIACLGASPWVVGVERMQAGAATLPMVWVAPAVVVWAVRGGRRLGAVAALAVGGVDLVVRGAVTPVTVNATVLLLLTGVITGYLTRLAGEVERQMQQAAEREAAIRERERLARGIHDSVLQVLALVQRRGAELGGEAARLGQLAGEQEATLRALVADTEPSACALVADAEPSTGRGTPDGTVDLRAPLNRFAAANVTVAAPAAPVRLPAAVAAEMVAAVGAALDNVRVHCGPSAPAWVLVEAEPDAVTVTVRDDGPGIPAGRLAQAAADGRFGVAHSIQGRMRDLGGAATVVSTPGEGTEVELRLPLGTGPRARPARRAEWGAAEGMVTT